MVKKKRKQSNLEISYGDDLDRALFEMEEEIRANEFLTDTYQARLIALKYLENDKQILLKGQESNPSLSAKLEKMVKKVSQHLERTLNTYPEAMIADQRYGYIKSIIKQGVIFSSIMIKTGSIRLIR